MKFCNRTKLCRLAALVGALALATTAAAQPVYPLRTMQRDCTRNSCQLLPGKAGSATAIGQFQPGKSLLLTAGHLTNSAVRLEVLADGRWLPACIVGVGKGIDLAVIGVDADLPGVIWADAIPAVGSRVAVTTIRDGEYVGRSANVLDHNFGGYDLLIAGRSTVGEYGGGVFDERGRLGGIVLATGPLPRPDRTLAASLTSINAFFGQLGWGNKRPAGPKATVIETPPPPPQPINQPERDALPYQDDPRLTELIRRLALLERHVQELQSVCDQPRAPPAITAGVNANRLQLIAIADRLEATQRRFAEFEARPVEFQILNNAGDVVARESFPLFGPYKLRFVTRKP